MRINAINIHAFGKLSRYERTFSNGFNLIYGDNEYGKTTIMAFIKMMFYGTQNTAADKAVREHYRPWNNDTMAGSIDFTVNKKRYILEREFAKTNSSDKIYITDVLSGEREKVSPKEPLGEKLFGCSYACFCRSIFIGQLNDANTDDAVIGEINKKLSNIITTGDEDISEQTIVNRLLNAKYPLMSKGGKIGSYDKAVARLNQLSVELERAKQDYAKKQESENEISALKQRLESLENEEKAVQQSLKNADSINRARRLKELLKVAAVLKDKEIAITLKDGALLDNSFLNTLRELNQSVNKNNELISDKKAELENKTQYNTDDAYSKQLSAIENEINKTQALHGKICSEIEMAKAARKSAKRDPAFILSLICLIVFAVLFGVFTVLKLTVFGIICAAFTAIGAVSLILSVIKQKSIKSDYATNVFELQTQEIKLQTQLNNLQLKKLELNSTHQNAQAMLNAEKTLSEQKLITLTNLQNEQDGLIKKLNSILSLLPGDIVYDSIETLLGVLSERLRERDDVAAKLNYIRANLEDCTNEQAELELAQFGELPDDLCNTDILLSSAEQLSNEIRRLNEQIFSLQSYLKLNFGNLAVPAQIQRDIADLQQTVLEQKAFCDSIDIALNVIGDAANELRSSYGDILNDKVYGIFSGISGDKYSDINISKSLDITVGEPNTFGRHLLENLSSGTKDQAYFALRLALSQMLFEKSDEMPLFLDDVFAQYDDTRAMRAFEYIIENEDRQILFFTCHKHFEAMANSINKD